MNNNPLLILGNGAPSPSNDVPIGSVYIDSTNLPSQSSGVPIGTIIMISSYNLPDGWLQLTGQTFDKTTYPELFNFMGTDVLPDYRGRFPRGASGSWINVPAIGTYQGDTVRNATGWITDIARFDNDSEENGVFFQTYFSGSDGVGGGGNSGGRQNLNFDLSRSVPTDWENRPLSVISNFIIKAK